MLAGVAFLMGLAQEDLLEEELMHNDPSFPLVVCARVDRQESIANMPASLQAPN